MDAEDIKLNTLKYNEWFIISITGKFVVRNLFAIRTAFEQASRNSEKFVAVDLQNTTHLDSSAITMLINFKKRCGSEGGKFIVFGLNQAIEEIFSIVGMEKIITVVQTFDDFKKIV